MFCFRVRFPRPRLTRNLRCRAHARDIHHPDLAPHPRKFRPRDPSAHRWKAPLTTCETRYRPHDAIPCPRPHPPHRSTKRPPPRPRSCPSSASTSPRHGLHSSAPLAAAVLGHLRASGVAVLPGLTELELAGAEAEMGFAFPLDLRAVLATGLPLGPKFPDTRSRVGLRSAFDLPIAAAALQITRGTLWLRCWGARPADLDCVLRPARSAICRAGEASIPRRRRSGPCRSRLSTRLIHALWKKRARSRVTDFRFPRPSPSTRPRCWQPPGLQGGRAPGPDGAGAGA
ncbi:hypothetical protein ZEAMMB73_Zm00001d040674 [Zea mays]|jgi:hypothetical protein|uniref:Uncharacterized protein n=1 Tax=Zea mays TaxID=4577 RepID=A0A1D6MS46_MAIZE|nr:hypothetical protein ZEAMMB73_Zm00001d040674 [Zea mays]